jgi:hypothetical protein
VMLRALPYPERKPAPTWSGLFTCQEDMSPAYIMGHPLAGYCQGQKNHVLMKVCDNVFGSESGIRLKYVLPSISTISEVVGCKITQNYR